MRHSGPLIQEEVRRVSALSHLRILDLSNGVAGEYCGKLLADFGAEVIKVEPPGVGSDTRRMGPFAPAKADRETSGLFAYLNTNKRSVIVDTASPDGREALRRLIEGADAVIDDHPKGYLESVGIDPEKISSVYPGLIVCAITPFGYDAPPNMRKAYSLNVFHGSGWGYHSPSDWGENRPPLKGAGRFLVDYESGLSAALALTAASYSRGNSGRGQFIDVSQQESMTTLADYVIAQMVAGTMEPTTSRNAFELRGPATFFQTQDGYVYLWLSEPGHWTGLSTLMGDPQWMKDFPDRWLELHLNDERIHRCRTHIASWMKDQQKADVAARAQKLGIPLVPVNTMPDVLDSPQLRFRQFFTEVEHPILGRSQYPGVSYRMSATPARIERAAPLLGEFKNPTLAASPASESARHSRERQSATSSQSGTPPGPLHGVRVLELTKIWAGPYVGKLLALLGAEVIRVESYDSLDATRRFGTKDINDAPGFQAINADKRSVQLNMKTAEGRRLVQEIVKVSDIVIENLRPGAADRLGLGYEGLRAVKPDIIAVSMSMHGHDGPLSYQTGYAPCFSSVAGICQMVGDEDGPPKLLNIRYGDSSYGTAATYAAIVALCHRQRTGEGQSVDVSAVEALSANLGDCFMDYFLTGHVPVRDGNRHPEMAPHGTYACANQEWLSIAVRTDEEWRALCEAMGLPALANDPRYRDNRSRQMNLRELNALVQTWTGSRDAQEAGEALRNKGVAAFKSLSTIDLVADENLWRRGYFTHVTDNNGRSAAIAGPPWHFSVTPAAARKAAPLLGEHNDYVLGELLGLSVQERQRLVAEKIVY
jgi:crotonobetainyl-CoA:carnitine CoA-transferase CaiB-like acyl-CoA transferase